MSRSPTSRCLVSRPAGRWRHRTASAAFVGSAALVGLAACGSAGPAPGAGSASTNATRATSAASGAAGAPITLRVLVTNDDGVTAPGIDAITNALRAIPGTQVWVVAPATNQSGQGGRTTPNVTYQAARTASGVSATAVNGHPADAVTVALDRLGLRPDLVVSGINAGQNLGPVVNLSGTVGAARAAVRAGRPALAVSQGSGSHLDFPAGVRYALSWIAEHRAALAAHRIHPSTVANLNVPSCGTGTVRGVRTLASDSTIAHPVDALSVQHCDATATPNTEVSAFDDGFATLTAVSPTPS